MSSRKNIPYQITTSERLQKYKSLMLTHRDELVHKIILSYKEALNVLFNFGHFYMIFFPVSNLC